MSHRCARILHCAKSGREYARDFAESVGFEPTEDVNPRLVSSEVPSTTQPTLPIFKPNFKRKICVKMSTFLT